MINFDNLLSLFLYIGLQILVDIIIFKYSSRNMEATGMFYKSISQLANYIFQNLPSKSYTQILNHAFALGLPIKNDYTIERIIFILSQIIINLIDEIVSHEKILNLQIRKMIMKKNGGQENIQNVIIQGNSTLNTNSQSNAGNLHLAAQIISEFCPKILIWDILQYISFIKVQLQKQDAILESINIKDRINYLPNLRHSYSCYCSIYFTQPTEHQILQCQFCGNKYHGECQYNPICCNSCFLRFCILDLKEQTSDLFNYNKETEMFYFSYIENKYHYDHDPKFQCIYFHILKFDIPELNIANTLKIQKNFYIKISLVNQIYNTEMSLPVKKEKLNTYIKDFWVLDNIEYHYYLNNAPLKITNMISDYAIIFKVPQRSLDPLNNILVIKCIKRNITNKKQPIMPYWKQPQQQNKVIMIGIYQTNKLKGANRRKIKSIQNVETNKSIKTNIINPLSYNQSMTFLNFIIKQINKIEYQNVDLIDVINYKKINIPARSFGCTHIQCFDLDQLKHKLRPTTQKKKIIKKKQKQIFSINIQDQQQSQELNKQIDLIQIQSNSIEIIGPATFNQQKNKQYFIKNKQQLNKKGPDNKKRRFKFKKQKQQKNSIFCPICNKKMMTLYIDPLFQQILNNSGFYNKVKILHNGEFNYYEPNSSFSSNSIKMIKNY